MPAPAALLEFFGRLHVLLLHAPIGLLIGLLSLEALAALRRRPIPADVRTPLAWFVALAAVASASTGFVLGRSGEFSGDLVDTHRILGIASAVLCVAAAAVQQWAASGRAPGATRIYFAALALCTAAMVVTGHKGGGITHGENYLLAPLFPGDHPAKGRSPTDGPPVPDPADAGPAPGPSSGAPVPGGFVSRVQPVLAKHCYSCHGPGKKKGGLALHTPEGIARGGDFGPIVTPGHPEASELIRRLKLPAGDDEHMPPSSKPQPSAPDIKAIEDWIRSGAATDSPVEPAADAPAVLTTPPQPAPGPKGPAAPSGSAVSALRAKLAHAAPVAQGSPLLSVDLSVAPGLTETDSIALLSSLRENIAELSAARMRVGDALAALAARMPNLRRLDLSGTDVTAEGVRSLAGSASLEDLVLTRTRVGDAGAAAVGAIRGLKRVYLWNCGAAPAAIDALRLAAPGLNVDAGAAPVSAVLESEHDITLTSEAAAPGGSAAGVAGALKPVNAACPVLGRPVDPAFALVHKGRVIGFCCRTCAAQFLEDPAKFEDKVK